MNIKMIRKIKLIATLSILFSIFLFTSCKKSNKTIVEDYPQVDENHIYVKIDVKELKNKINNQETFFLVMGFPKCSWCQNLMGPLNDVAKEENIEVIYYLDIKEIRDNAFAKGHKDFEKLSNTVFKEVLIKKTKKINSPTTMKIESGVLTKYHVGTVDSHLPNERGVLEPLTTTQKEELFIILRDLLSQS